MWIKICGVTSGDDAAMIAAAGADAIGLNFYPPSKRFVGRDPSRNVLAQDGGDLDPEHTIAHAKRIRDVVTASVDVVGVFVNSPAADVADIATRTGLTAVQFHGDEAAELIADFHQRCPAVLIIRAFRVGADSTAAMDAQLRQVSRLGVPLAAVLVDAFVDGEYGGTGHAVNADIVNAWTAGSGASNRLVLAGGLTAENVAAAANAVQPWGIDTASGVESSPGVKCPQKVAEFVKGVRGVSAQSRRLVD